MEQRAFKGREAGDSGDVRLGVLSVGHKDGVELVAVHFRGASQRGTEEGDPPAASGGTFSTRTETLVRRNGGGWVTRQRVAQGEDPSIEPNVRQERL